MLTELSDNYSRARTHGWILYDAVCQFCLRFVGRYGKGLEAIGFRLEPLQTPWVSQLLSLPAESLLSEMRVVTRDRQVRGGADAFVFLAQSFPLRSRPLWAWLIAITSRLPGGLSLLRVGYRRVAAQRHCQSNVCEIAHLPKVVKEGMR